MWILRTTRGQTLAIPHLPAVLGNGPAADVRIPHESVLPEHARLSAGTAGTLRLEALGDGAVAAAGQRVERALLRDGDELVLGRVRFTLHDGDAVGSAPAAAIVPSARPSPLAAQPLQPAPPAARPASRAARPSPLGAQAGRGAAAVPELTQRKRTLQFSKVEARRGLLNADLSQLPAGQRLALVLGVLLVAAALMAGIAFLVGLIG